MTSKTSVEETRPITSIKFLEMFLACLPEEEYKADVGSWSRAIFHLRNVYGSQYPQFFERFDFIERDPAPPHSDQVNYFLRIEQEGDIIRVFNPSYDLLDLPADSKRRLAERNKDLLEEYGPAVKQFVDEVLEQGFISVGEQRRV